MTYEPFRPSYDSGRLTVELVPSTAWWSNVRTNISRADWEKCKRFVRERSGNRCEICDGRGPKWPVECHEEWSYDDEQQIQTLVGLIALCPACHEVKHFGRSEIVGNGERVLNHLMKVNGWPLSQALEYRRLVFAIWSMRSRTPWKLDVSFLSLLGIQTEVKDRG